MPGPSPDIVVDLQTGTVITASLAGDRLVLLSSADGAVIGSIVDPGRPLAAAQGLVLTYGPPADGDPGRLALRPLDPAAVDPVWEQSLLDPDLVARVGPGIDEVAVQGRIEAEAVTVTGEIRTAYLGGAAPSDEILDEAERVVRFRQVRSRDDGALLEADTGREAETGAGPDADDAVVGELASGRPALVDAATATWSVVDEAGEAHPVRLEPGADTAAAAGGRIVYRIVEDALDGSTRRVYLRSRPLAHPAVAPEAEADRWSTLIEEIAPVEPPRPGGPPPPPPPPPR